MKVTKIATHTRPHIDEIAAIWILQNFGQKKYPGIDTAEVIYWADGGKSPDGRSSEEWKKNGVLAIGTGDGRLNEHPNETEKRKDQECVFTLVLKDLDLDEDLRFEKIKKFILNEDLKASSNPFDLSYICKVMHSQFPDNPEKVMEWVIAGLEAKYEEQRMFVEDIKKEFESKATISDLKLSDTLTIKIVVIEPDLEGVSKFARSDLGCNAGVIIQKQSSGNVQIFNNRKFNLNMTDTIQILRYKERALKTGLKHLTWTQLREEGKVNGAEEWYYQPQGGLILNGSLSAPNVPPTKIDLDEIKTAVEIGINKMFFDPKFKPSCQERKCTSSSKDKCPLYDYGLHRCRQLRHEQNKNK